MFKKIKDGKPIYYAKIGTLAPEGVGWTELAEVNNLSAEYRSKKKK